MVRIERVICVLLQARRLDLGDVDKLIDRVMVAGARCIFLRKACRKIWFCGGVLYCRLLSRIESALHPADVIGKHLCMIDRIDLIKDLGSPAGIVSKRSDLSCGACCIDSLVQLADTRQYRHTEIERCIDGPTGFLVVIEFLKRYGIPASQCLVYVVCILQTGKRDGCRHAETGDCRYGKVCANGCEGICRFVINDSLCEVAPIGSRVLIAGQHASKATKCLSTAAGKEIPCSFHAVTQEVIYAINAVCHVFNRRRERILATNLVGCRLRIHRGVITFGSLQELSIIGVSVLTKVFTGELDCVLPFGSIAFRRILLRRCLLNKVLRGLVILYVLRLLGLHLPAEVSKGFTRHLIS